MLVHIAVFLGVMFLFRYLAKKESCMFGSQTLMIVCTLGIAVPGFIVMLYGLPDAVFAGAPDSLILLTFGPWLALGYGVYWGVTRSREKAYYRRLYAEENGGES